MKNCGRLNDCKGRKALPAWANEDPARSRWHRPSCIGAPWVRLLLPLLLVVVLCPGCVSKAKARAEAQAAFAAGQQQALANLGPGQVRGPRVTLIGEVGNPVLEWAPGLTLARAIVLAEYHGATEPTEIFILRQGRAIRVSAEELLQGKDVPLEDGDIIQLGRR
jgi:hypothetical protein